MRQRTDKLQPSASSISVDDDGWLIKRVQTSPGRLEVAFTAFCLVASLTIVLSTGSNEILRTVAVLTIPVELALLARLPFCGIRLFTDELVIVTVSRRYALPFEQIQTAKLQKSGPLGEGKEIVVTLSGGEAIRTGVEEGAASIDVRAAAKLINATLEQRKKN